MKKKLTVAGVGLAAAAGLLGVGTAFAGSPSSTAPSVSPSAAPAVTTPNATDVPEPGDTPDAARADTSTAGDKADPAEAPGTEAADGTETAGSETADGTETGPSDGPGGYADPPGAVDTQQEGQH
jgi:hypothetical protein